MSAATAVGAPPAKRVGLRLGGTAVVALGLCVALGLLNLLQGEPDATLQQVSTALFDAEGAPDDDSVVTFLIRQVRLPRILLAFAGGIALGVAGVLLQDSLRNPLADPGLLGFLQAASFVVALASIYPELFIGLPLAALTLIAQAIAGTIVLVLAGRVRNPVRVVLIGAALSAFFATMSTVIVLVAPFQRTSGIGAYNRFVIGSVAAGAWDDVRRVAPWLLIGLPLAFLAGRALNLLQLGDEMALSGGLNPQRARFVVLGLALLLTAPVVASIGPIGFVALLSPHVARGLLVTSESRAVMTASGLLGGFFLLGADTIGRLLFFPFEVPAGVWTIALIGPAALWLVGRRRAGAGA